MYNIYELGSGTYVAGEGKFDNVPAFILTLGGTGVVNEPITKTNYVPDSEHLCFVLKFNNIESLDVIINQLNVLRTKYYD